jgi:YidC/Oxa1 family membrane protein insertase
MTAAELAKLNPNASTTTVKVVTGILIAIMVVTTYITQRQMIARQKNSPQPVDQQQLMVQRLMLYGVPVSLLISGALFPLGVVLYWCTTNLWSMGQQFYVLHRLPPPGGAPAPPPDPSEAAAQARALAPKPGVRPQASKKNAPPPAAGPKAPAEDATTADRDGAATTSSGPDPRPNGAVPPAGANGAVPSDGVPSDGVPADGSAGPHRTNGTPSGGAAPKRPAKGGGRPPAKAARKRKRR